MVVRVKTKSSGGSTFSGIVAITISLFFMFIGFLFPPLLFVGCILLVIGIVMISSSSGGSRAVVIQQPAPVVAMPVVQTVPVHRPVPRPIPPPAPRPAPRPNPTTTPTAWAAKAKNLELARDFEGAAKAYQQAGMYHEAGRIRQMHLEKKDQPMVQIGQVGDTVLNDSVMIGSEGGKSCGSCGAKAEAGWNICPHCSNAL